MAANEMINLMKAATTVVVSLTYCYSVSSRIPKGYRRLVSLLPILSIFTYLPLLFTTIHLQYYMGAFIAWLANFKLLLFAFARDDTLSVDPSISLLHFIVITTLPVKVKPNQQNPKPSKEPKFSLSSLNLILWFPCILVYVTYKQRVVVTNPIVIHFLYTSRHFFDIQLVFGFVGAIAKLILRQEIEPQFDEPMLSTSIQNFWGKRWNLMYSSVLKSAVHEPTRSLLTPLLGRAWAQRSAIVATFGVSGLMHELFFFYVGRQKPTWEVTWYLLVHAVCLLVEIEVKKRALKRGWELRPWISTVLTAAFTTVTTIWWAFAYLIHCGADAREIDEYIAIGDFIKHLIFLSGFGHVVDSWGCE